MFARLFPENLYPQDPCPVSGDSYGPGRSCVCRSISSPIFLLGVWTVFRSLGHRGVSTHPRALVGQENCLSVAPSPGAKPSDGSHGDFVFHAAEDPACNGRHAFRGGRFLEHGADPPGKNWPELLGELARLKVRNFSFGGAKVGSSLDNALRIDQDDALVILEIGGNDLLGGTSIPKFREGLEKMLALVCGSRRRVAMVELPLPPFYNRYGMVQRALAKSHGVTLIPKGYLAKLYARQVQRWTAYTCPTLATLCSRARFLKCSPTHRGQSRRRLNHALRDELLKLKEEKPKRCGPERVEP